MRLRRDETTFHQMVAHLLGVVVLIACAAFNVAGAQPYLEGRQEAMGSAHGGIASSSNDPRPSDLERHSHIRQTSALSSQVAWKDFQSWVQSVGAVAGSRVHFPHVFCFAGSQPGCAALAQQGWLLGSREMSLHQEGMRLSVSGRLNVVSSSSLVELLAMNGIGTTIDLLPNNEHLYAQYNRLAALDLGIPNYISAGNEYSRDLLTAFGTLLRLKEVPFLVFIDMDPEAISTIVEGLLSQGFTSTPKVLLSAWNTSNLQDVTASLTQGTVAQLLTCGVKMEDLAKIPQQEFLCIELKSSSLSGADTTAAPHIPKRQQPKADGNNARRTTAADTASSEGTIASSRRVSVARLSGGKPHRLVNTRDLAGLLRYRFVTFESPEGLAAASATHAPLTDRGEAKVYAMPASCSTVLKTIGDDTFPLGNIELTGVDQVSIIERYGLQVDTVLPCVYYDVEEQQLEELLGMNYEHGDGVVLPLVNAARHFYGGKLVFRPPPDTTIISFSSAEDYIAASSVYEQFLAEDKPAFMVRNQWIPAVEGCSRAGNASNNAWTNPPPFFLTNQLAEGLLTVYNDGLKQLEFVALLQLQSAKSWLDLPASSLDWAQPLPSSDISTQVEDDAIDLRCYQLMGQAAYPFRGYYHMLFHQPPLIPSSANEGIEDEFEGFLSRDVIFNQFNISFSLWKYRQTSHHSAAQALNHPMGPVLTTKEGVKLHLARPFLRYSVFVKSFLSVPYVVDAGLAMLDALKFGSARVNALTLFMPFQQSVNKHLDNIQIMKIPPTRLWETVDRPAEPQVLGGLPAEFRSDYHCDAAGGEAICIRSRMGADAEALDVTVLCQSGVALTCEYAKMVTETLKQLGLAATLVDTSTLTPAELLIATSATASKHVYVTNGRNGGGRYFTDSDFVKFLVYNGRSVIVNGTDFTEMSPQEAAVPLSRSVTSLPVVAIPAFVRALDEELRRAHAAATNALPPQLTVDYSKDLETITRTPSTGARALALVPDLPTVRDQLCQAYPQNASLLPFTQISRYLSNRPTYGGHIGRATFQVPFHLDRRHVVIALAGSYAVESYLEIGCETDYVFDSMSLPLMIGVDPMSGGTHRMTSDEFFRRNREQWHYKFDLVFIDGLHEWNQVLRDINNSLEILNPNGIILLHDMSPRNEFEGAFPYVDSLFANGDCWRAGMVLRGREDIDFVTLDADNGIGAIRARPSGYVKQYSPHESFEFFDEHREDILRFVNFDQLQSWLETGRVE